MEASFKARKGGPYKLNLHPKAFFDGNPYKSDRRKYFSLSWLSLKVLSAVGGVYALYKVMQWSVGISQIYRGLGKRKV